MTATPAPDPLNDRLDALPLRQQTDVFTPFILADVAWDYAESAADIAAQARLADRKAHSRRLRALRAGYRDTLAAHVPAFRGLKEELDAIQYALQQYYTQPLRAHRREFNTAVNPTVRGVDGDRRRSLIQALWCAHAAWVFATAAIIRERVAWEVVSRAAQRRLHPHILPDQLHDLPPACHSFIAQRSPGIIARGTTLAHDIADRTAKLTLNVKN